MAVVISIHIKSEKRALVTVLRPLSPFGPFFADVPSTYQAEEDRKAVLAKRFNLQLQKGLHDSLNVWKEKEELN